MSDPSPGSNQAEKGQTRRPAAERGGSNRATYARSVSTTAMASSTQPGCRVRTAPSIDLPLRSVVPRRSSTGSVSGVPEPPSARPEAVPEAADEAVGEADLFEVPPERFIATRDRLVKQLRADGRKADAARVAKRRRPPLTAWALNQVARRSPEQLNAWRDAGAQLRAAMADALAGDASGLRQGRAAERAAVDAVVAEAVRRLQSEGYDANDVTRQRMAATLRTATVDESVAALLGRGELESDHDTPGFGIDALGVPSVAPGDSGPDRPGDESARAPGPLSGDASTDEPGPMTTDRPETADLVERRNQAEQAAQQNDQRALSLRSEADGLRAEAERLGSEAERLAAEVERLRAESARLAAASKAAEAQSADTRKRAEEAAQAAAEHRSQVELLSAQISSADAGQSL